MMDPSPSLFAYLPRMPYSFDLLCRFLISLLHWSAGWYAFAVTLQAFCCGRWPFFERSLIYDSCYHDNMHIHTHRPFLPFEYAYALLVSRCFSDSGGCELLEASFFAGDDDVRDEPAFEDCCCCFELCMWNGWWSITKGQGVVGGRGRAGKKTKSVIWGWVVIKQEKTKSKAIQVIGDKLLPIIIPRS